jgi:hypothetical protein
MKVGSTGIGNRKCCDLRGRCAQARPIGGERLEDVRLSLTAKCDDFHVEVRAAQPEAFQKTRHRTR